MKSSFTTAGKEILTPRQLGFVFPAEWHPHRATWLTFPHNDASWQGEKLAKMRPQYLQFIRAISEGEQVGIIANDIPLKEFIREELELIGTDLAKIEFVVTPTNDSWCRDHGPAFVINPSTNKKMIIDWEYNAWGGKYPPYFNDNKIPREVAKYLDLLSVQPGIVMEGGAVEFNGAGTLLTSRSCLLNPNRNPGLSQVEIEKYLHEYYGVEQVLWVEAGIAGDDTDGHIDDTTRFLSEDTIVACVENNPDDENYAVLKGNLKELKQMRLLNGKQLEIIELPMPAPMYIDDFRVPVSYANFLICNAGVIVPVFNNPMDEKAVSILESAFKTRKVIPLPADQIIWGQGSFHCLTQQEPEI